MTTEADSLTAAADALARAAAALEAVAIHLAAVTPNRADDAPATEPPGHVIPPRRRQRAA